MKTLHISNGWGLKLSPNSQQDIIQYIETALKMGIRSNAILKAFKRVYFDKPEWKLNRCERVVGMVKPEWFTGDKVRSNEPITLFRTLATYPKKSTFKGCPTHYSRVALKAKYYTL